MDPFGRSNRISWPIITAVGLVVLLAWGVYAWRFASPGTETPRIADSGADLATSDSARSPLLATHTPNDPYAALRTSPVEKETAADKEAASDSALEPLSSAVSVNSPGHMLRSPEMRPGEVVQERSRPPQEELDRGRAALARGDLHAARVAFSAAVGKGLPPAEEAAARSELERIAEALLYSRAASEIDPYSDTHTVQSGESLARIAARYKVTPELLTRINQIDDPNWIRVGQRLKVIKGPFRAVISKGAHRMDIYLGDAIVESFRVGLGTNGGTPLGLWQVQDKLTNPEWADPTTGRLYLADDPTNPIGEHWIGLHGVQGECVGRIGFGIHGTIDPKSIGENMSLGCVRLAPADVARVYDFLVNKHSTVTIVP